MSIVLPTSNDTALELCPPDPAPRPVEDGDLYILFQLAFILSYFAIAILCGVSIYQFWAEQAKQGQRLHLSNNRLQVITALGIGSFVRGLSFITLDCVGEELLKTIKDIAFLTAFTLIVLFWVELQTYVRNMQSISKLRPALLACIGTYSVFRLFAMMFAILQMDGAKNVMTGLTIVVYLGVMGVGIYYGRLLLMKMKSMKKGDMKSRLKKLTYFIILEGLIYLLFLISWGLRRGPLGKMKQDEPVTWFWLKAWEKLLEFFGNLVLCLTMTTSSKKGAKASGERERKRTMSSAARDRDDSTARRELRDGSTASSEPVNGAEKLAGPDGTVRAGAGVGTGRGKGPRAAAAGEGKGVDGDSVAVRVGMAPGESKAAPGRLTDTINPLLPEAQARRK